MIVNKKILSKYNIPIEIMFMSMSVLPTNQSSYTISISWQSSHTDQIISWISIY